MASVYRPSGRKIYRIEFKDQHGRTRTESSGMRDRRSAEGLAGLIERDVDRLRAGLNAERPDITGPFLGLEQIAPQFLPVAQIIETYLADLERQAMSPATLKHRKKQLNFLARGDCWKTLHDVTTARVTALLAAMTAKGRSVGTTNAYRDTLNAFLEWCISQAYLKDNPVHKVKRARVKGAARPGRRRAFTPEELRAFLRANPAYQDYYLTAALTGLRLHELSLVERRDFNLEAGVWTCREEVDKMNTEHRLPIMPDLVPTLRRVGAGKRASDRLFPEQQSNATFNRHLERAGIVKVSEDGRRLNFHSLRYTFCTLLANKLPLKAVQRLMRHAQLAKTADLYLQLELDSLLDQVIQAPALFSLEAQDGPKEEVA
jgi:integrase